MQKDLLLRAVEQKIEPIDLVLSEFDSIYKRNAYTVPYKYSEIPWGGFIIAYEEIIRERDLGGKFLAQLNILVK